MKTNQEDLRTSLDIAHLISGIKPPKKETKVSKPRKRKSFLSIGTRSGSLAERHGNYGPSTAWATKLGFHSGWWHTRGRIIWFYSGHWLWCVYIYIYIYTYSIYMYCAFLGLSPFPFIVANKGLGYDSLWVLVSWWGLLITGIPRGQPKTEKPPRVD